MQRASVRFQLVLFAYLQVCTWLPLGPWNGQYDFELPDALYPIMGALELVFVWGFVRWNRWLVGAAVLGHLLWLWLQIDSWWIRYIEGYPPGGRAFYEAHFAGTWKLLPSTGDHLAPDAMHLVLQVLIVCVLVTATLDIRGHVRARHA
ncbi:MAG TPA: hypothetical protein VGO00_14780 [Kofleriaceae bacterium]|nr:hypothetical protein [Kofleriaceae bacterium]